MNLEEAHASWFKKEYESQDFTEESSEVDIDELRLFANHCLGKGVKCVYITIDSRGCLAFFKQKGKFNFAGGIGFGMLQKPGDYVGAARYGNTLGALRTQGKTFTVFKSLEETNSIIQQTYFDKPAAFDPGEQ
jgi:adenosine kinase